MDNKTKVKVAACRIAFLMPHQDINPDLILEALNLHPIGVDLDKINKDSPEYLLGAMDALTSLINMLEGKGPQIRE